MHTTIQPGEYDLTVDCANSTFGNSTGTFTGAIFFTDPTHWNTGNASASPPPVLTFPPLPTPPPGLTSLGLTLWQQLTSWLLTHIPFPTNPVGSPSPSPRPTPPPTTTTLSVTPNPAHAAFPETLLARVTPSITGTVTFYDDYQSLGSVAPDGGGYASLTTQLPAGTYRLTALFSPPPPDSGHLYGCSTPAHGGPWPCGPGSSKAEVMLTVTSP